MQFNDTEKKKLLDEGMLTRSLIENEVAMKKCLLYSEMAQDASVKSFFKEQAKGLEDVNNYMKNGMAAVR
ncbi:Hypothetical protein DEACI_2496 [Acididesulfobacillus acetoxydans]|uniref:Uncharacterized protein n=1 Tax=Acididesulfobacillus acetoxydans TaxID=1561005 RepID=A0A8S0XXK7_9FIRM|nr:hypothetical protein [Acididesulfobacillus acetoxydans]KLU58897.1 hypothetical protein CEB3_c49150 [Peptococcaceae bacterium CEB3]CAA7601827.1 Hypothetical protein DEACI_2496 [Acididesulfobacillus acetoxydans]CEJ09343.1 Hypothetical protein DEACI_3827 [Acididesulfobacillus acetoxydans]